MRFATLVCLSLGTVATQTAAAQDSGISTDIIFNTIEEDRITQGSLLDVNGIMDTFFFSDPFGAPLFPADQQQAVDAILTGLAVPSPIPDLHVFAQNLGTNFQRSYLQTFITISSDAEFFGDPFFNTVNRDVRTEITNNQNPDIGNLILFAGLIEVENILTRTTVNAYGLEISPAESTVVPLPAAGWMMLAGIGALAGLRRFAAKPRGSRA